MKNSMHFRSASSRTPDDSQIDVKMRRWGVGGVGGIGSGGGILRKSSPTRKPQLLVFGYSCKLFRDDERALDIDLGRHLIPCMGDDSLKIDRYDARGALGPIELAAAEGSGNSSRGWERLTAEEQRAERLCDEERYRALYCDEDEEEMYREEELKRIHMSNSGRYGQVEFNYDIEEVETAQPESKSSEECAKTEDDEPFIPPPFLTIPSGMAVPETQKLNTIIEKTASFIASHGTQMEILLKAKQSGNPQFEFLSLEYPLHAYYNFILTAIKEGRHKLQEDPKEDKVEEDDNYLHPSLAPLSVQSAPSIPSISYKPSADCAYSMLVNQIKGSSEKETQSKEAEADAASPVDTELAPPGTEPFPIVADKNVNDTTMGMDYSNIPPELMQMYAMQNYYNYPAMMNQTEITKAPVLYNQSNAEGTQTNEPGYMQTSNPLTTNMTDHMNNDSNSKYAEEFDSGTNSPKSTAANVVSTGLKLTHYYNSDSENESDGSTGSSNARVAHSQLVDMPPQEQQVIIDKMASYVARNGNDFEQIVKMKGDPRFSFLDTSHKYNPYYRHKRSFYERISKSQHSASNNKMDETTDNSESDKTTTSSEKKVIAPVSFSIKKMKEPEPILPKPALPYESTSEEETENHSSQDETSVKVPAEKHTKSAKPEKLSEPVQKADTNSENCEEPNADNKNKPLSQIYQIQAVIKEKPAPIIPAVTSHITNPVISAKVENNSHSTSERKWKDNEKNDKSLKYATESSAYVEHRRKRKHSKADKNENPDIITIDEEFDSKMNSEFIDLTGECNEDDTLYYKDNVKGRIQLERKKRAAAFLSSLKTVPAAPIEHHNTLASAMVKTLNTLQSKEEKSNPKHKRKRDRSPNRKMKKKKSDKRHSNEIYNDSDDDYGDSRRHSSRDSYKSRSRSHDRHSRKSRRKRSPDYYKSKSHKKEVSSRDAIRADTEILAFKNIDEEFLKTQKYLKSSISRKNDEFLTASLKELVREARKELTPSQPIKMAVDIFSNEQSNVKCASDNEWEKDSNGDDTKQNSSEDSGET